MNRRRCSLPPAAFSDQADIPPGTVSVPYDASHKLNADSVPSRPSSLPIPPPLNIPARHSTSTSTARLSSSSAARRRETKCRDSVRWNSHTLSRGNSTPSWLSPSCLPRKSVLSRPPSSPGMSPVLRDLTPIRRSLSSSSTPTFRFKTTISSGSPPPEPSNPFHQPLEHSQRSNSATALLRRLPRRPLLDDSRLLALVSSTKDGSPVPRCQSVSSPLRSTLDFLSSLGPHLDGSGRTSSFRSTCSVDSELSTPDIDALNEVNEKEEGEEEGGWRSTPVSSSATSDNAELTILLDVDSRHESLCSQSSFWGIFRDRSTEYRFLFERLHAGFFRQTTVFFSLALCTSIMSAVGELFSGGAVGLVLSRSALHWCHVIAYSFGIGVIVLMRIWFNRKKKVISSRRQLWKLNRVVINVVEWVVFGVTFLEVVLSPNGFQELILRNSFPETITSSRSSPSDRNVLVLLAGLFPICCYTAVIPLRFRLKAFWVIVSSFGHMAIFIVHSALSSLDYADVSSNLLISFALPLFASLPRFSDELMQRKRFSFDVKAELFRESMDAHTNLQNDILSRVIPTRFFEAVRCGNVILERRMNVSILELDVVGFTLWSARVSCVRVISFLNSLFTTLDRAALAAGVLKLRQEGDAWICISIPLLGQKGILALLRVGAAGLAAIEVWVDESGENCLAVRLGVEVSEEKGYVVAWGIETKSLDFVSSAMDEAIRLEGLAPVGQLRLGTKARKMIVSELPEELTYSSTSESICLTLNQLKAVVAGNESSPTSTTATTPSTTASSMSDESSLDPISIDAESTGQFQTRRLQLKKKLISCYHDSEDCFRLSCSRRRAPQPHRLTYVNLFASFLSTLFLFLDVQTGIVLNEAPWLPILGSTVGVMAVFGLFFLLVYCARNRDSVLHLVQNGISITTFLLRTTLIIVVCSTQQLSSSLLTRSFCWDWTYFFLHPHVHPLFVALTICRVPLLVSLYSYISVQEDVLTAASFVGEPNALVSLLLLEVPMLVVSVVSSLSQTFWWNRIDQTQRSIEDHVESLRLQRGRNETLLNSLLPLHVREARLRNEAFEYESVQNAGVIFVRFAFEMDSESNEGLPRPRAAIRKIHTQISKLDDVVHSFPSLLKIKSSFRMYLCVTTRGYITNLIDIATAFLRSRLTDRCGITFKIGIALGPLSAGIIGEDRWCFDVVGEPANLAARLATVCDSNGVLCLEQDVSERLSENDCEGLKLGVRKEVLKGFGRVKVVQMEIVEK